MFGEGMCYGQYCELCKTADSQICTLETNNTVYVNIKPSRDQKNFFLIKKIIK